jgi:FAD/FMN-containing dehydrogenase
MGGQTFVPDGLTVNMLPLRAMTLDADHSRLHVEAGAVWSDIIRYLDARGLSVAVMQSNNSFSVGGSLSVNCHGWQYGRPPIASTVESFRLIKADGEIVHCSRSENSELFSLVLGGYGLFGVILDVELRVVANRRYRLERFVVQSVEALPTFDDKIASRPDAAMVYARMNVSGKRFLEDVILCAFVDDPATDVSIPKLTDPGLTSLRRAIFRGSANSEYGKEFRWTAETKLQTQIAPTYYSRNQLLNDGVEIFQNRSADSTDILHEYFLPRGGVEDFVIALRRIVPAHHGNLLNVTVRAVQEDRDSFLRFADQRMLAFVMLFQQPRSAAGDDAMQAMTRDLIDTALASGGRYYLPYRLHATPEQFRAAYPQASEFFRLKRQYDPDELFQNQCYQRDGREGSTDVGTQTN